MEQQHSIADVLSGNAALQFEVKIERSSLIYLGITLVLVAGVSMLIWRAIKNS